MESQRNLDMAHDLLDKGEVSTPTMIKYANADQVDSILAS